MKDSTIRVVSHLMGDGHVNSRYLRYNNKNDFLREQFIKDFVNSFGVVHFIKGVVNSGIPFVQVQNKKIINQLFKLSKSYLSGDIEFPNFLKTKNQKILFVKSLFDDEGTVGFRVFNKTGEIKRDLHLALKSRKMIRQLKYFLDNSLYIKTNKIVKDKRIRNGKIYITWVLYITGKENLQRFKEIIGFHHPDKIEKLEGMLNSYIRK